MDQPAEPYCPRRARRPGDPFLSGTVLVTPVRAAWTTRLTTALSSKRAGRAQAFYEVLGWHLDGGLILPCGTGRCERVGPARDQPATTSPKVRTVGAPTANVYAERWVRTVRAECLDWLQIVNR